MEEYDYRNGVMLYDFTGLPLQEGEVRSIFCTAVLYIQQEKTGPLMFMHAGAEGLIECVGEDKLGGSNGWRFILDFGEERVITFLLPYRCEDAPIPKDSVVFKRRRKAATAKPKKSIPRTKEGNPIH